MPRKNAQHPNHFVFQETTRIFQVHNYVSCDISMDIYETATDSLGAWNMQEMQKVIWNQIKLHQPHHKKTYRFADLEKLQLCMAPVNLRRPVHRRLSNAIRKRTTAAPGHPGGTWDFNEMKLIRKWAYGSFFMSTRTPGRTSMPSPLASSGLATLPRWRWLFMSHCHQHFLN